MAARHRRRSQIESGQVERGAAPPSTRAVAADHRRILRTLLDAHPDAFVVALDDAATRVPLPAAPEFAGLRELTGSERTVIDYVDPADRMAVVTCWERARSAGVASCSVRLTGRVGRDHLVTILDCRESHDVCIEVLTPRTTDGAAVVTPPISLPEPRRARTGVVHKNLSAVITEIDDRTTSMLGWAASEMVGRRSLEFVHPDDQERAVTQWLEMRSRQASQRVRLRHRHRDGGWVWLEVENEFVGLDRPDDVVAIARMTDVSDEMAAVEAVRRQERLFRRLAESLPVGVIQIDRRLRVVYRNARADDLLGVGGGQHWSDLTARVAAADRPALHACVIDVVAGGRDRVLEVTVAGRGDQLIRHCQVTVASLFGEGESGVLVSIADVTPATLLREQLHVQATRDPLTGCLNRAALLAEIGRALGGRTAADLAVIFIDLDGFKAINDTYGHAVGDELLAGVGGRLRGDASPGEVVARFGGDEFVVLVRGVTDEDRAQWAVEQVRRRLTGPLRVGDQRTVHPRASFGLARSVPMDTADDLVRRADQAMYRAKKAR